MSLHKLHFQGSAESGASEAFNEVLKRETEEQAKNQLESAKVYFTLLFLLKKLLQRSSMVKFGV